MSEIIPNYGSTNWAPLKPLLDLKEGGSNPAHYIADSLRERFKHYKNYEEQVFREIYSAGVQTALFIEGKQLLIANPYTGGWKVLKPAREDASTKRAMNLMQFYADNCLTKWLTSDPNVRILPGNDTDKADLSARYANTVNRSYKDKFYTVEASIQEGLSALIYGTYINEYKYDSGAQGPEILKDIFETQTLRMSEGYGVCGDCGAEADGMAFMRGCPNPECRSMDVQVTPPEEIQVNNIVGQEKQKMGDLVCRPESILSTRWDLRRRLEESPWLIRSKRVPLTAIRTVMGNVKLPGGDVMDVGLDMLQSLAYSGQAIAGKGIGGQKRPAWEDEVTVNEFWMSVECYGDIELKGDEQSVNGEPIPAGHLRDLFPEHLCVVGLNDMSVIVGLYAEDHKKSFVSGTWHSKANSGIGRGMIDTVEVQKRFNILDSQELTYLQGTATPAIMYNQALIQSDEMQYLGTPGKNIPVDMRQLPEGSRISDAMWQFQPGSLPANFTQYKNEFLNHMFQLTSLVTDFTGGLNPVVRNYTATGANISAALSNSLFTPMLAIKSSVRKRGAQLFIPMYRDYFPMERYFSHVGKYGRQQAISLKGADIDNDLLYEVVKDSELPRNSESKKEAQMAFFQNMGGAEGYITLKERYPEMVGSMERLWDIDVEEQSYDVITGVCRNRLSQLKAFFQTGIADPAIMIQNISPPISQFEPQQKAQAIWWQDFLITDEGFATPIPMRVAVEQLIMLHFQHASGQAQAVAMQAGLAEAAQMLGPGALQMLGQQMAPQASPKAETKEDPEQAAKDRINYKDAPPSIQKQQEADAGFKPAAADNDRPPLMAAKAQMIVAKKPAPKAAARPAAKKKAK